jgi:hypothetical protein
MSLGWWTILDTHGKQLSVKKPSSVAILDTFKPESLAPTTPFKCTYILCHAHVSIVSRLKNLSLTCLLHFIYTERDLTGDIKRIIAFTWIHLISLCHGKSRFS